MCKQSFFDDNHIDSIENEKYKQYISMEINNRNQALTADNYNLEWVDGGAIITFVGKWQKPISYIVKWDNIFGGKL